MTAPHVSMAIPFTSSFQLSSSTLESDAVVKAQGLGDPLLDTNLSAPQFISSLPVLPSFDRIFGTLDTSNIPTSNTPSSDVAAAPPSIALDEPVIVPQPSNGGDQQQQQQNTANNGNTDTSNNASPVTAFPAAPEAVAAPIPASSLIDNSNNWMPAATVPSPPAAEPPPPAAAQPSEPSPPPSTQQPPSVSLQPSVAAPSPPPSAAPVAVDSPSPPIPAAVQAVPSDRVAVTNPVDAPSPPPPAPKPEEAAHETPTSQANDATSRPPLSKPTSTPNAPSPSSRLFSPSSPSGNYMDSPDNGGVLSANDSRSTAKGGMSAYAYAGIVLAGVVAGIILLVFARRIQRRRREHQIEAQDAIVFEAPHHHSASEPSQEEMMTMTAIMQEATPKPSQIGSQRTSLMAWAKPGRRKKHKNNKTDMAFAESQVAPVAVTAAAAAAPVAYEPVPQHRLSAVFEEADSEDDEDEDAIRNAPGSINRTKPSVSAKLTAMMSNKSNKYAGTVSRRYSQVPEMGQVDAMMGQEKKTRKRQSMPQSNVINLGSNNSSNNSIHKTNGKMPKLAPAKEFSSASALEQIVNEKRMRTQKSNAGGTFANFAARPTSVYTSLENVSSPTPKHRWSLATSLEEAADRMVKTYSTDSSPALSIKMPIAKYGVTIGKKIDVNQSQESIVSSIDMPAAVSAHSSNHSLSNMLRAQASRISLPETVDSSSHASDDGRAMPQASSGRVHASVNAMQAAVGGKIPSSTLMAPVKYSAPSEAGESVSHGSDSLDSHLDFDIHRMRRQDSPASSGNHLWSSRNGMVE